MHDLPLETLSSIALHKALSKGTTTFPSFSKSAKQAFYFVSIQTQYVINYKWNWPKATSCFLFLSPIPPFLHLIQAFKTIVSLALK